MTVDLDANSEDNELSARSDELGELLRRAHVGDKDALGELLNCHRPILKQMSTGYLGDAIRGRIAASDVVQQSLLSAIRNFGDFAGTSVKQFEAWMKQIHRRNLMDVVRDHAIYQKRATNQEAPRRESEPIHDRSALSPSKVAMRREADEQLRAALERLPENYRLAVQMRHLEGCSLVEIAARLGKTRVAAAGDLKRGLKALREQLDDGDTN